MNAHSELSQDECYELFHRSCFPRGNDWRLELEPDWLNHLRGEHRERAIREITEALDRFEFGFRGRIVFAAEHLLQREAIPFLEKGWRLVRDKIKRGDSQSRYHYGTLGYLAAALYGLSHDEGYIADIIESVREDPFSALDNVTHLLFVPTSTATIDCVWKRLDRERDIVTRSVCLDYLNMRLNDPMMQQYVRTLSVNEGRRMLQAIEERRNQIQRRIERQREVDKSAQ